MVTKLQRADGGCSGARRRWRTRLAAISHGEPPSRHRSVDFPMGQPAGGHTPASERWIHSRRKPTGGSETSQYPEEYKATAISLVEAIERESA